MDSVSSCNSYDLHERLVCSYRPSNLTKEISLFDCIYRKTKIIAVGLILWFLSACSECFAEQVFLWIKSRYLQVFCLPISLRYFRLSPLSEQLVLWFIIQDILSFLIPLPSYYVSGSCPLLDHHVTALIWGCYSVLRCSLIYLPLMQQNQKV